MISFSRSIVLEDNRRQRKQENLPPLTSPDSRIKIVEVVTNSISSYGSRSYMKWVSTNTDRMEGEILSRPVGLDFHTEAGFNFSSFFPFPNPSENFRTMYINYSIRSGVRALVR